MQACAAETDCKPELAEAEPARGRPVQLAEPHPVRDPLARGADQSLQEVRACARPALDQLAQPARVREQPAHAERVAVRSSLAASIASKSALRALRLGPLAAVPSCAAVAMSCAQVKKPSSGSCCPIERYQRP